MDVGLTDKDQGKCSYGYGRRIDKKLRTKVERVTDKWIRTKVDIEGQTNNDKCLHFWTNG